MKNFVQSGHTIDITAPAGGVASGAGIIICNLFGVASSTAAAGETVALATTGVFDLPKASATAFAVGGAVAWDAVEGRCDAPGEGRYPIGVAIAAAAGGASTVRVRLDGITTAAAAA